MTTVLYRERLVPDAPPVEVTLPDNREQEFDLLATVARLAKDDPEQWKSLVRAYTASDWYFLALFLSGTQRLDPFHGRPEIDCDFQFNYAREMQLNSERLLDKSFRGGWKSTWRTYVGAINVLLTDPNSVIAIVAHEKAAAQRHGVRTMLELENNVELKAAWDDALYSDPRGESPLWSQENGFLIKRTIPAILPSLSWHSILSAPTGSRISLFILDDIEDEGTVESPEMREKTLKRVTSFLETGGRVPRIWVNGTHFHSLGVVAQLEKSGSFRTRCHQIEDTSKPAPDIAKLYDECGGIMPLRNTDRHEELPPAVRNIRLDGEPVYFHPLEVAQKRLDAMSVPGGLVNFYRQNFGDSKAGESRTLDRDWIRWYNSPPHEWARDSYLYILVDPSKGQGDPTWARVEACKEDGTVSWVGGFRRKVQPSEFGEAIFLLYAAWEHVGRVVQIRVEEFAQSTWTTHIKRAFDDRNAPLPTLVACAQHNTKNKESVGRYREWSGLEPLYRMGRRIFPKAGIWEEDEAGIRYNLVDYYIDHEYGLFPQPHTDDGLAADYLLAVGKGKGLDGREMILSLEFPDDNELEWRRELREMREAKKSGLDDGSWMSGWAM